MVAKGGVHGCWGHAWLLGGGMHGCQGACVVAGGHAWLPGGMCGCQGACMLGACVVAKGGACMVAKGGCVWLPRGGMCHCQGVCVVTGGACVVGGMHGCRGACVVAGGHAWLPGGCVHGCQGGVPCDLSHHAFDVTCMLSPHQLRASSYAPAYILVGHVTRMPRPPCGQTDTCKNITFANFVCGR